MKRRTLALIAAVTLALVSTACETGRTLWASCSPGASMWGVAGEGPGAYVTYCNPASSEWEPVMTALEYVKLRQGEKISIAPVPTKPTSGDLVAPTWDQIKNSAVPSMCGWPAVTLVDGSDPTPHRDGGGLQLFERLYNGVERRYNGEPGLVRGIPSDRGPLTAVVGNCSGGGVGWPDQILFFAHGGVFVAVTDMEDGPWASVGLTGPGRGPTVRLTLRGSDVEALVPAYRPSDALCCASVTANVRVGINGTTPIVRAVEIDSNR